MPLHPVTMTFEVVRTDEEAVMRFIRSSIDRGNPVLFFDTYVERPFVHEWNLIYAYDDLERKAEATDVVPPYRKTLHYAQLAASPVRFLCTLHKTYKPAQPSQPYFALQAAVNMMRAGDAYIHQTVYASYVSGLTAYDAWIRHLEEGPRVANAYGHRYMAYVYASAKSFAGPYIRSLQADRFAETLLERAAAQFDQAAGLLREISRLSPLRDESEWNAATIGNAIDKLKCVKRSEEQAVCLLEEAVRMLEAKEKTWEVKPDERK